MYLPQHIKLAYAREHPTFVMIAQSSFHRDPLVGVHKSPSHFALRNGHFSICDAKHNTTLSKALQAKYDGLQLLIWNVHYKNCPDQE